jgi:hypothetical protein
MDLTAWALYAFVAAGALVGALLHYQRREPAGRGRLVLAGLRGGALALLLLLLFNPVVPSRGPGPTLTVALVDGSLSMRLAAPDGTTRWEEAARAVAALGADRVLVFGEGQARVVPSMAATAPDAPSSRLAPALGGVLEAGAGRVVVVTDGALEDAHEVERLARERDLPLQVVRVGDRTAGNLGLVELDVPGWARSGEPVEAGFGVARLGSEVPESVTVALRWADRTLARAAVPVPPEGRLSTGTLRFTPPPSMTGRVRLDAVLEVDDAESADNQRSAYVAFAERPAGVALVSFSADQEPRFLLPVLERSLGVPARGWLAVGRDRFVQVGVGREAGVAVGEAEVRRALAEADILVLHGLDDSAPAWARSALRAPRVLLFARGPLEGLPFRLAEADAGEWHVVPDLPPSPLAPYLAAVAVEDAPPLTALLPAEPPVGWWAALGARPDRRGAARPVLVGGEVGERRLVVALSSGYWRWAFEGNGPRSLYEALWAGVGGWLLEGSGVAAVDEARPEARVWPRGSSLRWLAPPGTDSVRVSLRGVPGPGGEEATGQADATPGRDTVLVARDGVAVQEPPPPGHYRYEALGYGSAEAVAMGTGELTVERYSPEFTRPARPLGPAVAAATAAGPATARPARPLRSSAWPYLALLALLCAEWVLRRRWGLR